MVSGTRPPPCAYFSITKVDEDNAVLFGGRGQEGFVNDHIYNINLKRMVSLIVVGCKAQNRHVQFNCGVME